MAYMNELLESLGPLTRKNGRFLKGHVSKELRH